MVQLQWAGGSQNPKRAKVGFPGHPAEHRGGAHIHMWSGRIGKLAFEAPPVKDSCLLLETSYVLREVYQTRSNWLYV